MEDAQSRLLKQLVKRSPSGILVSDAEGRMQMVNPAARSMIPIVPNPEGRLVADAIPIPEIVNALMAEHLDPITHPFSNGSRDLLLRSVSLESDGRLVILEDVTQLRQAERYRREFVANVSHELRTPATSIAGYAEFLLDSGIELNEDAASMVQVIHRNALRLNALFEDLLTLAKIDAQSGPMPKQRLALLPIVNECVDKQRARAEARGVLFQVMVSPHLDVHANRDAMNHIVGNLVENAVKYNREDGLVTVRAEHRADKHKVLLEVIDLGMGMAPAHLERIFERFFRVDKARSRDVGGTGLGLSIVKHLLERMEAHIEVRSRVGKGSIFRLWLDPVQE
ncbi:MAG: ATP-binding protein [Myxococcota bacterium]|nr:ATP-binding protein [Myxococcota bacterium]